MCKVAVDISDLRLSVHRSRSVAHVVVMCCGNLHKHCMFKSSFSSVLVFYNGYIGVISTCARMIRTVLVLVILVTHTSILSFGANVAMVHMDM